jgi:hypothetical protein
MLLFSAVRSQKTLFWKKYNKKTMNKEDGQKNEETDSLINPPALGLQQMAGTIMTELEKNEKVKEVVVHLRVVRLPKKALKNKSKHCKAKVSTVSYKFNVNKTILHKMLARKRQKQQRLQARLSPSLKIPTASSTSTTAMATTSCVTSQGLYTEMTRPFIQNGVSNINHSETAPFALPTVLLNQLPFIPTTGTSTTTTTITKVPSIQQESLTVENLPFASLPNTFTTADGSQRNFTVPVISSVTEKAAPDQSK